MAFEVGEEGLSEKEAKARLKAVGLNQLKEPDPISPWKLFLAQFKDFMVLVLLGATLISGLLGEYADAITITAIIILNAILGFIQEYRAERSIDALKKLTAPEAKVIRGGQEAKIPAAELVPGDIVLLETGDRVPADLRLLQVTNLEIEESPLTGESVPVRKTWEKMEQEGAGLGDRRNLAFLGTVVTRGRGRGVVVATGMDTEMGKIAGLIQDVEQEDTPLQKRLAQLGRVLVVLCLAISALVVVTGVLRGEPPYRMFLAGVSLAVAAIPEGLPAIVTIALAVGVQKMIRRQAIIRKLPAVETLGCATVICSDKTGTLTQNEMTVRRLYLSGEFLDLDGEGYLPQGDFYRQGKKVSPQDVPGLMAMLKMGILSSNALLKRGELRVSNLLRGKKAQSDWQISGDPTEGALVVAAAKAGIWRDAVEKREVRLEEIPFDSERKRMTVIYRQGDNRKVAYLKGAPDVILGLCHSYLANGRVTPLSPRAREGILGANREMASQALRVLALAYRELPNDMALDNQEQVERDLVFVGLVGMIDPPRPAAKRAVEVCRQAGIRPVMITGDHPDTAWAIARELTIAEVGDELLTGAQLEDLSEKQLAQKVERTAVYARVSPAHKLRIVRALKSQGHVVAMTGDGVNDAPAIKEADIGIAMGKGGTDVTKEASAMVLGDDNFVTIVAAVEEGRAIYDNIRKFIRYLLSCNTGEVLTMFLAALLALPLPLLPIQILWVNLVTDGLPAMALGVDKADPGIMARPPRSPKESIFARGLGFKILSRGIYISIATLSVFCLGFFTGSLDMARTMAFTTLVFSQLFHVFDCRSEHRSIFQVGFFSNPYLVGAVSISVIMQMAVIYLPWLQAIFKTVPLGWSHWLLILAFAGGRTFLAGIMELVPRVMRRLVIMKA